MANSVPLPVIHRTVENIVAYTQPWRSLDTATEDCQTSGVREEEETKGKAAISRQKAKRKLGVSFNEKATNKRIANEDICFDLYICKGSVCQTCYGRS